MEICSKIALELNPRYLASGFRSQARNIAARETRPNRQLACLMSAISQHILKHGSYCYASDHRLLTLYNQFSASFGVRPIKSRTLTDRIAQAESSGLIKRDYRHNDTTGQTQRLISVVIESIQSLFSGVFNYASGYAIKHHSRQLSQKLRSGRSNVVKSSEANQDKRSNDKADLQNCERRSKDLSKERKRNKYNGQPSDDFYLKFFKQDANDAKSLQLAAREKRLNASGAKKLIALHAKHGFELAKSFKRYLHSLLGKEHSEAQKISSLEQRVHGGNKCEAMQAANEQIVELEREGIEAGTTILYYDNNGRAHVRKYWETMPSDEHVSLGRAQYVRDGFGRVQIEWLSAELWP